MILLIQFLLIITSIDFINPQLSDLITYNLRHSNQTSHPSYKRDDHHDFPEYSFCGDKNKMCFGLSRIKSGDCISKSNCLVLVTMEPVGSDGFEMAVRFNVYGYAFEYKAVYEKWIGVALSHDNLMGEDIVVECLSSEGSIRVSYNKPFHQNQVDGVRSNGIDLKGNRIYDNGKLHCSWIWEQKSRVIVDKKTYFYDFSEYKYHILVARGSLIRGTSSN